MTDKKTFEEALHELEDIVAAMENADLPLDDCIRAYERGVTLAAFCTRALDSAQKRIEKLEKTSLGAMTTTALDEDDIDENDPSDDDDE